MYEDGVKAQDITYIELADATAYGIVYVTNPGAYFITGSTNQNHISIEGVGADLWLYNVNIDSQSGTSPIAAWGGGGTGRHTLGITLFGDNTLSGLDSGTSSYGLMAEHRYDITIAGPGALTTTGTRAGIGCSSDNTYSIISGTIHATGQTGAGLGGTSSYGNNSSVAISGGQVYASSASGPGLGAWGADLTISGGAVHADSSGSGGIVTGSGGACYHQRRHGIRVGCVQGYRGVADVVRRRGGAAAAQRV